MKTFKAFVKEAHSYGGYKADAATSTQHTQSKPKTSKKSTTTSSETSSN